MRWKLLIAATLAGWTAVPAAPAQSSACNENCLLGIAGAYLDGLAANDTTGVPLAATLRSTENGVDIPVDQGIWHSATSWSYRHTFVDPTSGGIGVFGTVDEGGKKVYVAIRLKVAGGRITESERMVAREGDFSLFNPVATEAKPIFGEMVAPEYRSTRAELAAIATSYLDGIRHGDPSHVPFHPDCNRVEDGVQTTNNPPRAASSCADGLHRFIYMQHYRDLRFPVIDTARGLVWAVTAYDLPLLTTTVTIHGKPFAINPERQHLPRTIFLYELFKVEGGKIRQIEAEIRNMPLGASMGWAPHAR